MKDFFLILCGLIISFSALCQANDTLIYNSERKLTWSDFKGKPKLSDKTKGAQITVTINLKVKKISFWNGRATYDAFALAFTDASWVKPAYKDAYTLAHEQLHFDIAHIYAETLEIEINRLKKSGRQKDQVENILREHTQAMREYQALYDQETHGGNDIAKQKEWARKIGNDLKIFN